MKTTFIYIVVLLCAVMLSQSTLAVTTIGFEGFGSNTIIGNENIGDGLQIGSSDGFNFTSSGDHFHFGSGLVGVPVNGTSILLQDRDYSITMTDATGAIFDLLSADMGEDVSFHKAATSIVVEGFFATGGSIITTVALDGDSSHFQLETFSGFTNLTSVTFKGIGYPTPDNQANGFTLDNITVVPEPATMALLGLGGLLLRKRKCN